MGVDILGKEPFEERTRAVNWPSSSVARVTSDKSVSSQSCVKNHGHFWLKSFEDRVRTSSILKFAFSWLHSMIKQETLFAE